MNEAPERPVLALHAEGLLSEDVIYEDTFVAFEGAEVWAEYMLKLRDAGRGHRGTRG
jgi:hypothetical protein